MIIHLGFCKRDSAQGFKAGDLVLVQTHEPKGGDLLAFDWRTEDLPDSTTAHAKRAPVSDGSGLVARHKLAAGVVTRASENDTRLQAAKTLLESKSAARVAAGEPIPELEQKLIDELATELGTVKIKTTGGGR